LSVKKFEFLDFLDVEVAHFGCKRETAAVTK